MRTIHLNATHPEIQDAGDEFRLLMTMDGGRHYRFLAGPAATREDPPAISLEDRLYPVVTWEVDDAGVQVKDAAWPARLAASSREIALLRACDGRETIDRILRSLRLPPPERADVLVSLQRLVNDGVLCPVSFQ